MSGSEREIKRIGRFVALTEIVGLLGLIGGIVLLVQGGETVAAGVFLLASAVAYGLGANALLRR